MDLTFADRLVVARRHANVSQSFVAARLNRNRSTVIAWESGQIEPKLSDVHLLAQVLGCSVAWLATGEQGPEMTK